MDTRLAAVAASALLVGLICFQLLLAAGLPLGRFAWGGAHTVLPTGLRIASVIAVFVYVLAIAVILERAGVTDLTSDVALPRVGAWVLAALFGIGILMNAISRSRSERVMALVAFALAALTASVALAP